MQYKSKNIFIVANFENFEFIHDYYIQSKIFKNQIKKILQSTVCKEISFNVWNQWIIRVLGKGDQNWHIFPSKKSIESDRDETVKHMRLKLNSCGQDPNQTYDQIIEYAEQVYNKFNEFKIKFLNDIDQIELVNRNIDIMEDYVKDESQKGIIKFKLNTKKFYSLKSQYENNCKFPQLFNFYLLELLHNYNFLEGQAYQWAVPPAAMQILKNKFQVEKELFASPLNHYFEKYFSVFEIDKLFGSNGNSLQQPILNGNFEVNPPFIEETMQKISKTILSSLEEHKNDFQFFFFALPWKDCEAFKILSQREFLIDVIELKRLEHFYFEHQFNQFQKAPFNTWLILVGTHDAKIRYNSEIRNGLIQAFKK